MKPKGQAPKAIAPAEPVSKHEDLNAAERAAREAFALVKQINPAKGASLSSVATTALFKADLAALRGEKIISDARRGHEGVHGTHEEKQRRWQEYQKEVARLYEAHPQWSWSAIAEQAGKNMACCAKTIYRNCTNPRKKT